MDQGEWSGPELVLAVLGAAASLERIVDGNLSAIKGISLAEFRLLAAIAEAPGKRASRAEIARVVGLSPSAVTRALRPLESLGLTRTVKNERDARLALATLTPQGEELLSDAIGVLEDVLPSVLDQAPSVATGRAEFRTMLSELARL
jgi:DNA-binding MarR family transcriptional regulator